MQTLNPALQYTALCKAELQGLTRRNTLASQLRVPQQRSSISGTWQLPTRLKM